MQTGADTALPASVETEARPFSGLTPDEVLTALDMVGLYGDGRLLQLNSYENRVFQVYLEDAAQAVVAKFYRPQRWTDEAIVEEHQFAYELQSAEVPVIAPLALSSAALPSIYGVPPSLACYKTWRFAVWPRIGGYAPNLEDHEVLLRLGCLLGRLHQIGAQHTFSQRPVLDTATFGYAACDWLLAQQVIPLDQQSAWKNTAAQALVLVEQQFEQLSDLKRIRLHGDCHLGNILWNATGPYLLDLDDACMGPAIQDVWMLLEEDALVRAQQLEVLLSGYRQFYDFDQRELKLIEPLRTLRMIHHSAWLAKRWHDPAFPMAFPWFASSAYWTQQTQLLRQQVDVLNAI